MYRIFHSKKNNNDLVIFHHAIVLTSCGVRCLAARIRALSRFLPGIRSHEESIFAIPQMVLAMCY